MTSETRTPTEEDAVRDVLDGVYAAWAANDADAFVSGYARGATATLPGTHLPDRAAIRAQMAELFRGPLKGSHAVHEVRAIRFPRPGLAVVTSRGATVTAGRTEPGEWALETWVLSKGDRDWTVEAFHSSQEVVA